MYKKMSPCPFCGSMDVRCFEITERPCNKGRFIGYQVYCLSCGAEGPGKYQHGKRGEIYYNEAVDLWNRRCRI